MEANRKQYQQPQWRSGNLLENLFIVILAFYPLRHIGQGIDLWDTGYNYANFRYMGTEHMGSMWMFSTYLANVAGNWLTKLPNADTLRGMNLCQCPGTGRIFFLYQEAENAKGNCFCG